MIHAHFFWNVDNLCSLFFLAIAYHFLIFNSATDETIAAEQARTSMTQLGTQSMRLKDLLPIMAHFDLIFFFFLIFRISQ